VNEARRRVRRGLLATVLLAQGTPMLGAGDEMGHSQQGNNNAYCHDSPLTWLDWDRADTDLTRFVGDLLALRRAEPALRHDRWFRAPPVARGERSATWFTPGGREMTVADWHDASQPAFACQILGSPMEPALEGSARLLLAFNPEPAATRFALPPGLWQVAIDSSGELAAGTELPAVATVDVPARALLVLKSASA
jgi:isoamylase